MIDDKNIYNKKSKIIDSDEERTLEKIKEDFTCPICISLTKEPLMTPCGHLFCLKCIENCALKPNNEIDCPKCRFSFNMNKTILIFDRSTHLKSKKSQKSRKSTVIDPDEAFNGRRFGNILLSEEIKDSLSLRSIVFTTVLFLLAAVFLKFLFSFMY